MHDLRALVVDDSKVGRLTMLKKLEAMGVTVDLAESGQQALDYLARHRPGVIFMDHMMPDMDGFEVTRRIKASPAIRDIPVIVVSGNEDEAFFREARAAGAIDAIPKPPANEVLETLLASLPKRVVEAPVEPTPQPVAVEPAPAPSVDMAELHVLLERLVGAAVAPVRDDFMAEIGKRLEAEAGNQRKTLEEWGERLDRQSAAMAEPRRGAVDAETLGNRLQALEQRLVPLETQAGRPLPDFDALRTNMEQRVAAGLAELQVRVQSLAPRLESLGQGFQDLQANSQARLDDHAARVEQRAGGWDSRLDTLSEDLGRVSRDVQSLRSTQADMEQRIAQMRESINGARRAAVPVREELGEAAGGVLQSIQAELGELRERLSEARLRQLVAETLGSLHPTMAARQPVEEGEAPLPAVGGELHAEVDRLQGKVKALTAMTAIGGAILVVVIGAVLLWG
jgi:CheY-like chemotaxis protein